MLIPTRDGYSIQARLYSPQPVGTPRQSRPLFIYLHGGGYMMGNLDTEDMHCRLLCTKTPSMVLSVNYRHTPEWTFPTAFHDVFDAVNWIAQEEKAEQFGFDRDQVFLTGVSAGATMALAAAVIEADQARRHRPKHVAKLIYSGHSSHTRPGAVMPIDCALDALPTRLRERWLFFVSTERRSAVASNEAPRIFLFTLQSGSHVAIHVVAIASGVHS